ncbi:MAG: hypothetical protein MJZ13_06470 [Bacteroidales bacterium]|nr:hypothetical protein [Bacteroidales bacterium]
MAARVIKKSTSKTTTSSKLKLTRKPATMARVVSKAKAAPAAKPAHKIVRVENPNGITVNGNKIMKTLQREFSKKFNYLTLCFIVDADREKCVNVRGIDTNKRLSEVRKKMSTAEISIHGRVKVSNIENYFWKELGIACQIGICNYNGHSHYFPIGSSFNGMTLSQANEQAKSWGCKTVGATELDQICKGNIF